MLLEGLYRRMSIREGHVTLQNNGTMAVRYGSRCAYWTHVLVYYRSDEAESRRTAHRVWQLIYNRRIATWARRDKTTETSK